VMEWPIVKGLRGGERKEKKCPGLGKGGKEVKKKTSDHEPLSNSRQIHKGRTSKKLGRGSWEETI